MSLFAGIDLNSNVVDVHAEGFASTTAFAERWAHLYGPSKFYGHVWRIVFELVSENEKRAPK